MAVYPIVATPPAYFVRVASGRQNNIWYVGEPIVLEFWTHGGGIGTRALRPFTGRWYVRDYDGKIVRAGTATSVTSVTLNGLPLGWYRIYLTQTVNDPTYRTAAGASCFSVVRRSSKFPDHVGAPGTYGFANGQQANPRVRGISALGPYRYNLNFSTFDQNLRDIQAQLADDRSWYLKPGFQDPVRPRRQIVLFPQRFTDQSHRNMITSAVTTLTAQFGTAQLAFEGPWNEPGISGAEIATAQQIFYGLVKAVDPDAYVLGPTLVSINDQFQVRLDQFFGLIAAMDPVPLDGFSFHPYNCLNGDLALSHRSMRRLRTLMVKHGLQGLPLWQTEQGWRHSDYGVFTPRRGTQMNVQQTLLLEQYGITKERDSVWYDQSHGFFNLPHFFILGDGSVAPCVAQYRVLSEELWGMTLAEAYRFGEPGDSMMLGSRYRAPDGRGVLVFQAAGGEHTIRLRLTGPAGPVAVVDAFGNVIPTQRDAVSSIRVGVGRDPVYVRLPNSATVTLDPWPNIGPELSHYTQLQSYTASGSAANVAANLRRAFDGKQNSTYYFNSEGISNHPEAPYVDDTGRHPSHIEATFKAPTVVRGVVVFCAPLYQRGGALIDFDIQTWDGTVWVTRTKRTENAAFGAVSDASKPIFAHVSPNTGGGCTVESYYKDHWIFDCPFPASVSTTKLRVLVRDATWAQWPTVECHQASPHNPGYGENFTIRECYAY